MIAAIGPDQRRLLHELAEVASIEIVDVRLLRSAERLRRRGYVERLPQPGHFRITEEGRRRLAWR